MVTVFFIFCYILVFSLAPLLLETRLGEGDVGSDPAQWLLLGVLLCITVALFPTENSKND